MGDVGDVESANAALRSQRGDGGVAAGRRVEERVENSFRAGPGEEVIEPEPAGQLTEEPRDVARLAGRLEDLRHQVQVRVGRLAPELLEPGGRRPHQTGQTLRGVEPDEAL